MSKTMAAAVPPPPPRDDFPPPPPPEDVPPPPQDTAPPPPPPDDASLAPAQENGSSFQLYSTAKAGEPRKRAAPNKTPLSVEEILRKKKEADEAAAKPTFLSKKQREQIALEKRRKEVEQQKADRHDPVEKWAPSSASGKPNGTTNDHQNGQVDGTRSRNGHSIPPIPTGPRALRDGEIPKGPAAMRPTPMEVDSPMPPPPPRSKDTSKKRTEEEAVKDIVKQRYLGQQQMSTFSASKKRKRTTDKKVRKKTSPGPNSADMRQFSFDWSANDDTSNDYNPLYQNRAEANFYGRGRLGGMAEVDDEATRRYARAIEERDGESGRGRAIEILEMERRRREDAKRHTVDSRRWDEKLAEDMTPRDWRLALSNYNISVKGGNVPNPARNWKETNLPQQLLDTVADIGYTEPSAIQRMAIPIALQGRDVIGIAETGSGKTAAFALPLLVYISGLAPISRENPGPYAIILAPTRELAQQITGEFIKLAKSTPYRIVSITGGHSIEEQAYQMRDGAEIVVATPGRLVDVIERRLLVLGSCCYVIMDEADRMIDMGFQEPLEKILAALPVTNEKPDSEDAEDAAAMNRTIADTTSLTMTRYRQTMLFSATFSAPIQRLSRAYTRRPAEIQIGEANTGVDTVVQQIEFVQGEDKRKKRLADLLNQRDTYPPPCIVFVNVKRSCDALARDIRHMGHSAVTLHGSKTQDQREGALAQIRRGEVDVLVATDLAARGIDVPDVSLVVNFQLPSSIEPYLHRIGRTGRAGKSGVAVSFISDDDKDIMYDLKGVVQRSSLSRVPEELRKHQAAMQKGGRGREGGKFEESGGFGGKGGGGF